MIKTKSIYEENELLFLRHGLLKFDDEKDCRAHLESKS